MPRTGKLRVSCLTESERHRLCDNSILRFSSVYYVLRSVFDDASSQALLQSADPCFLQSTPCLKKRANFDTV